MQDTTLTEREQSEVKFSLAYFDHFQHGTDGHSRLVLIAKLWRQNELLQQEIQRLKAQNQESYMD
jgi:hypothetical protein